jgi:HEPN domain-containing protein
MTPLEEAKPWIRNADGDFAIIEVALAARLETWNHICFHAQQGAEKYLKAFLIANSTAPPKTHDLAKLLELAIAHQGNLSQLMNDCTLLTPFAVAERYALQLADEASARAAIAAAYRVRDGIKSLLI